MVPCGISQNSLARCMGVPPRRINEIVNGKRAITADTALELEGALGIAARSWMKWQANFDLEKARVARIRRAPRLRVPSKALGGWIPFDDEPKDGREWWGFDFDP